MKIHNHTSGFTLIELMIVLTIAAILLAIGYPAYQQYIIKSRRADATSILLQGAQYMERFFTENGRYDQDTGGTAFSLPTRYSKAPQEGSATFYNIAISNLTQTTFTLTATRSGNQTSDTDCGDLTLNHTGVKCINGGANCSNVPADQAAVGNCW